MQIICIVCNIINIICDFNFLTKKEISEFCLNSISENSPIGYILEIDLEYCQNYMIVVMIIH